MGLLLTSHLLAEMGAESNFTFSSLCLFSPVPDGHCFLLRADSSWLSPHHGQSCRSSSANFVLIFDLCPLPATPIAHILSIHTHTHTHTHTHACCLLPAPPCRARAIPAFKSRSSLCTVVPSQTGRLCPRTRALSATERLTWSPILPSLEKPHVTGGPGHPWGLHLPGRRRIQRTQGWRYCWAHLSQRLVLFLFLISAPLHRR